MLQNVDMYSNWENNVEAYNNQIPQKVDNAMTRNILNAEINFR